MADASILYCGIIVAEKNGRSGAEPDRPSGTTCFYKDEAGAPAAGAPYERSAV
jgi:hypothetical protein